MLVTGFFIALPQKSHMMFALSLLNCFAISSFDFVIFESLLCMSCIWLFIYASALLLFYFSSSSFYLFLLNSSNLLCSCPSLSFNSFFQRLNCFVFSFKLAVNFVYVDFAANSRPSIIFYFQLSSFFIFSFICDKFFISSPQLFSFDSFFAKVFTFYYRVSTLAVIFSNYLSFCTKFYFPFSAINLKDSICCYRFFILSSVEILEDQDYLLMAVDLSLSYLLFYFNYFFKASLQFSRTFICYYFFFKFLMFYSIDSIVLRCSSSLSLQFLTSLFLIQMILSFSLSISSNLTIVVFCSLMTLLNFIPYSSYFQMAVLYFSEYCCSNQSCSLSNLNQFARLEITFSFLMISQS